MSLYSVLSKDVQTIARLEWLTFSQGTPSRTIAKFLQERKTLLSEESRQIQAEWGDYLADISAKSTQRMRGMLSQFLSTPLTSDNQEINRILGEQVQYVTDLLLPTTKAGVELTISGKVSTDVGSNLQMKKLASGAKRHFGSGSARKGRSGGDIVEEMLIFKGSANLDILQILEDRLHARTARTEPEGHISSGKTLTFLRFSQGDAKDDSGRYEAVLVLDGRRSDQETILGTVSTLTGEHGIVHASVWEDFFRPHEISIRLRGADRARLRDVVHRLADAKHSPQIAVAVKKGKALYFVDVQGDDHGLD